MWIDILEICDDGDKFCVFFQLFKDVEGIMFLSYFYFMFLDDQWIFFFVLKRVKCIFFSNQFGFFMGSEFVYEDMNFFEVDKYIYEYLCDDYYSGKLVYVLV